MGYGQMLTSGLSSRPPGVSREEWMETIERQDAECHNLLALYLNFSLYFVGFILVVMAIASFVIE